MKSIVKTLLIKRWYLFILIGVATYFMTFYFWFGTNQFFKGLHLFKQYQVYVDKDYHVIQFSPEIRAGEKMTEVVDLLVKDFIEKDGVTLYKNETSPGDYMGYGAKSDHLHKVTVKELEDNLIRDPFILYIHSMWVSGVNESERQQFEKDIEALGYPIKLDPAQELYDFWHDYFMANLYQGIAVAGIALTTGLVATFVILKSTIRICKDDIRTLRVLGLPQKKLRHVFEFICLLPIFIGLGFFFYIVFIKMAYLIREPSQYGTVWQDYVTVPGLNILLISLILIMIRRQFRQVLPD